MNSEPVICPIPYCHAYYVRLIITTVVEPSQQLTRPHEPETNFRIDSNSSGDDFHDSLVEEDSFDTDGAGDSGNDDL